MLISHVNIVLSAFTRVSPFTTAVHREADGDRVVLGLDIEGDRGRVDLVMRVSPSPPGT